jgi:hypothetical protein
MRHLVVVEPEVVTQLVNHGLAHLLHSLLPRAADAVDRSAKHGDLVREQRHVVRPFGERDATVDAEQLRIGVGVALEVVLGRLVLGLDDNVLDKLGEPRRKRFQCFADDAFEFIACQIPATHLRERRLPLLIRAGQGGVKRTLVLRAAASEPATANGP